MKSVRKTPLEFQPGKKTPRQLLMLTPQKWAESYKTWGLLALGIQEEQDRQLQQLDLLSDSVDKAYERIRTDVRQVNKLT